MTDTDKEIIEGLETICEIASGNIKYAKDNSLAMNTYNIGFDYGCISVARKMIAVIKGKEGFREVGSGRIREDD